MRKHRDIDFMTTHWTRILGSQQTISDTASDALNLLCTHYRQPIYHFILRRVESPEEAEDLTQSFFAGLIEKKHYRSADPNRGKFRTFLLSAVKNFLLSQVRNANVQKRGGRYEHISIETTEAPDLEDHANAFSDSDFDQQWAIAIFDSVWKELEVEYKHMNQGDRYQILRKTLTLPEQGIPYADLAEHLQITVSGVKSAVFRLRSRFRERFRAAVAQVVENPAEIDEEIRYLMMAMINNKQSS